MTTTIEPAVTAMTAVTVTAVVSIVRVVPVSNVPVLNRNPLMDVVGLPVESGATALGLYLPIVVASKLIFCTLFKLGPRLRPAPDPKNVTCSDDN